MTTASFYDEDEAATATAGTGQNLMKANLFNLIVVASNPERITRCQELIRIITEKYPCRIIFVKADPTNEADYVRSTTTLQTVGTGSNRVLCDLITIEASLTQFPKIPYLVLPHILPDLPLSILLSADPTTDKLILPELQSAAQRVIFDVDEIENISQYAQRILAALEHLTCDCIDMHWAQTRAWRDALSRVFNTSELFSQLFKSKTIQLSYVSAPEKRNVKSRPELQAIYIVAWLAAKLGWSLLSIEREEKNIRISFKYDHVSVIISLVPKDTEILPAGALFSFEAMSHCDFHFLVAHENDPKIVKVHASNPERCEMPYSIFLPNYQNGPALVSELFYQAPSEHYLAALKELSHIMWSQA